MRVPPQKVSVTLNQSNPAELLNCIFVAGIWIRLLVFPFLGPFNNDGLGHFEHIKYFKEHWSMPPAGLGNETWQPPLYYFISAGFAFVSENPKFLQAFSLVTSIAILFVARELVRSGTFLKTNEGKLFAFLIVCLLPQFVMFSLYISNDSLAILLGLLAFYAADRLLTVWTLRRFLTLIGFLALGLLTKGQFLIITSILFPWACFRYWKARPALNQAILPLFLAFDLLGLGSLKYIQNIELYNKPFVSNLDFTPFWLHEQQGTYQGLSSIFDINAFKLIRHPILDESTQHSIPLMFYGTFWYQYIPESTFKGNLMPKTNYVGRYQYLAGILPATVLIVGGLAGLTKLLRRMKSKPFDLSLQDSLRLSSSAAFFGTVALLLYQLSLFDNWSILQARSLFPAILGSFILFDIGIETLAHWINTRRTFKYWQSAFLIGSTSYFVVEVTLQLL